MDVYTLTRQLREVDLQRDHARAMLADAHLSGEAAAKRAARRAKELITHGTYTRPGPWDDDMDNYPETSYEEDAGDGYRIRINRARDGTYNGYAIIPASHPYIGCHYSFFNEAPGIPRPPQGLTYGGVDPHNWCYPAETGVYGFYFMGGCQPRPDYASREYQAISFFSAEKAEFGGYITYADMRRYCLELVDYFKGLPAERVVKCCEECDQYYTTAVCLDCTCEKHNLALEAGVCVFCEEDNRRPKRSWADIAAGRCSS
jgi:hypothetical protein